jgi:hypothetical protein
MICIPFAQMILFRLLKNVYIIFSSLVAKVYRVLQNIYDTVPPYRPRVHVHMFTIIQFLRARAIIHYTVLEG